LPRFEFSELKDLVYSRLENNRLMYKSVEVGNALNEAIRCASLLCGWYQSTYDIRQGATIPNRHIYDVPEGIIFVQKVSYEGQALEKVSLSAMVNNWPIFLQDTTNNTGNQVSRFVPIGIKKFAIHPADSVGGGLLQVTGISEPDVLVNDTDLIYIPKEGVTAVVDYAAHIVQCKLQGAPFMQSLSFFKTYESLVIVNKYWQGYKQPTMYFDEQVGMQ
jgi:hypothetical protein